ncbi:MAG: serine hydrolase [Ruthenibacterium lactatiformans]
MKKCAAGLAALFLIVIFLSPRAFAAGYELPEGTSITAQSAYFVNLDTGIVVFEQNADEQRSVASLTKLMTALLLMENVSDLENTKITAERSLYSPSITNPDSSTADIRPGETVSALNMLYAMMLPSANEAAEAVGYYLGNGNLNNFYALMNARAAALGCTNTNFTSTNGLVDMDAGNYSSAHDLALIAQECWKHEIFRTVVGTATYQMPAAESHSEPYTILSSDAMIKPSPRLYTVPTSRASKRGPRMPQAATLSPPPSTTKARHTSVWCWARRGTRPRTAMLIRFMTPPPSTTGCSPITPSSLPSTPVRP